MSVAEEVGRLASLKEQGHLTEDEFEVAKKQLLDGDDLSPPEQQTYARSTRRVNGLSIAALILGLVGLGIGSVFALLLGYRAKGQIDRSEGQQSGRGLAITGIVLGWIGLVGVIAIGSIFFVARAHEQREIANVQRGMRASLWSLQAAQDNYTQKHPGKIYLNLGVLYHYGYRRQPHVNMRLYGRRGGGYCANAIDAGIGGSLHISDSGEPQEGSCEDTYTNLYHI